MDGFEVKDWIGEEQRRLFVVTTTGNKDIVVGSHFEKMKDKTIVCNIGHFDNEIDNLKLRLKMENTVTPKLVIEPQI